MTQGIVRNSKEIREETKGVERIHRGHCQGLVLYDAKP
jgi:hypothetical protein